MVELPNKKYNIIYADPPWSYDDKTCSGTAVNHYSVMSVEELKKMKINSISNDDCILFMWATYPKLREALEVINAWGFKYKTVGFNWVKTNKKNGKYFFGIGYYTKSNAEICLIATKGKPKPISNYVSSVIVSPRREHSRKPDEVRDKIVELMGNLPRIELFARQKVDGWDCWGNEV